MMKNIFVVVLIAFTFTFDSCLVVKAMYDDVTSKGNEFYVVLFVDKNGTSDSNTSLHVTNTENTTVCVQITTFFDTIGQKFLVQPNTTDTITVNFTNPNNTDFTNGIRVKIEDKKQVLLYVTDVLGSSKVTYAVSPHRAFSVKEYVHYMFGTSGQGTNVITVVAGEDKTTLTVFPSVDIFVKTETDMYTLPKQRQVFEFEMDAMNTLFFESTHDTTSTKITATKPVSITYGHDCVQAQSCCVETLRQSYPTFTWGRHHVSMQTEFNDNNNVSFTLLTEQPHNTIDITCTHATDGYVVKDVQMLNEIGDYVDYTSTEKELCVFESTFPIQIHQMTEGNTQNTILATHLTLVPLEQFIDLHCPIVTPKFVFPGNEPVFENHTIGIFVKGKESPKTVALDNQQFTTDWKSYDVDNITLSFGLAVTFQDHATHVVSEIASETHNEMFVSVVAHAHSPNNHFTFTVDRGLSFISGDDFFENNSNVHFIGYFSFFFLKNLGSSLSTSRQHQFQSMDFSSN